jgi:hypothetical protein
MSLSGATGPSRSWANAGAGDEVSGSRSSSNALATRVVSRRSLTREASAKSDVTVRVAAADFAYRPVSWVLHLELWQVSSHARWLDRSGQADGSASQGYVAGEARLVGVALIGLLERSDRY